MSARVTWMVDIDDDEADLDNPVSIARAAQQKILESRMDPVLRVTQEGRDPAIVDLDDEGVYDDGDLIA